MRVLGIIPARGGSKGVPRKNVRMLGGKPLSFGCSCSRERVESMLVSLGEYEALAAAADGEAKVRCEFCGEQYIFTEAEVRTLLQAHASDLEAPERSQ